MAEIDPRIRALYYLYLFGQDETLLHCIFRELKDREACKIIWDINEKVDDRGSISDQILKELIGD